MITETVNYIEAVERLPHNGTLVLYGVPWDEYEEILVQTENNSACRVSYNEGILKTKSSETFCEHAKDTVSSLAMIYADELDIMLESYGSTTYRRRPKTKGVEPDTSFYVQNAARMIGRKNIDLENDPPPDVVVEVDMTNESFDKLEIYAALGVPEIWRYDGIEFQILLLVGESYEEAKDSSALPKITGEILTEYLNFGQTAGQTAMLKAFRRVLKSEN